MTSSDQRFPPAGLRQRRRYVVWTMLFSVLLAVVVATGDVLEDNRRELGNGDYTTVSAKVVNGRDGLSVRYRHPGTEQRVTVPLKVWTEPAPTVGDDVKIVVGNSPVDVMLLGDRFFPAANSGIYVGLLVILLVVGGTVAWNEFRLRRLGRSRGPATTPMIATVSVGRRRKNFVLNLYGSDAVDGDRPRCSVPLATIPPIGTDTKFRVDVVGRPARLGRVVAKVGNDVLWPTGRARWDASRPLPTGPVRTLDLQSPTFAPSNGLNTAGRARHVALFALPLAGALVLVAVVSVLSLRNEAQTKEFLARAEPAVGVVVGEADDLKVIFKIVGDDSRKVKVEDEYFEELPKGMHRELLVDPDRYNNHALLGGYRYEVLAPILFALVPLAVVLVVGAAFGLRRRSSRRVVRKGPWRQFPAVVVSSPGSWLTTPFRDSGAQIVLLDSAGTPIASMLVDAQLMDAQFAGGGLTEGPRTVVVAGDLVPGRPAVVWPSATETALATGPVISPAFMGASASALESPVPGVRSPTRIALASYRYLKSNELLVFADRVEIRAARWFGKEPWSIPIDQVGVQDLTKQEPADFPMDGEDEPMFAEPIVVPYLYTANPNKPATVALYFKSPQRIPPITFNGARSMTERRKSRSGEGLHYDGVELRTTTPGVASASIVARGGEQVHDPMQWWMKSRAIVRDSSVIDRMVKREKLQLGLWVGQVIAMVICFGAMLVTGFSEEGSPILWVAVAAGVSGMVLALVGWLLEQRFGRSGRIFDQ